MSTPSQPNHLYIYTINIQSIKMKVKFPCKMQLQYNGNSLTTQVSQNEQNKFVFNSEIILNSEINKIYFEIIANIITNKGAKYLAGILKLIQADLLHMQGQTLNINLVKCIDNESTCQLRIDQVSPHQPNPNPKNDRQQKNTSPQLKQHCQDPQNQSSNGILPFQNSKTGTKSQFQFPLSTNRPTLQFHPNQQPNLSNQNNPNPNYNNTRTPSPNFHRRGLATSRHLPHHKNSYIPINIKITEKQNQIDAYRENYHKIQQKYKRQMENNKLEQNKILLLQNNQNTLKIQLMRLKLKSQQHEKILIDKNNKIKQLIHKLSQLQKRQLDISYLQQQLTNKQHKISILQNTIKMINEQNTTLKIFNNQLQQNKQNINKIMEKQLQQTKQRFQYEFKQWEKSWKNKDETIVQKERQIRIKDDRINKQQKLINQLTHTIQTNIREYERRIQSQHTQFQQKSKQLNQTITNLQNRNHQLELQTQNHINTHQNTTDHLLQIQYNKKLFNQEQQRYRNELIELQDIKEKYQELAKQHRLTKQQKTYLQKQYDKLIQLQNDKLSDINKKYQQQLQLLKKIQKDTQDKLKSYQTKLIELQSINSQQKIQHQKIRKTYDSLLKQLTELKQKKQIFTKTIKQKQQSITQLTNQLQSYKNQCKNIEQLHQYQIQNLKQQIAQLHQCTNAQSIKGKDHTEKIASLQTTINRYQTEREQINTQYQKNQNAFTDKINALTKDNQQHHRKINQLNKQLTSQKSSTTDKQSQIQKLQQQLTQTTKTHQTNLNSHLQTIHHLQTQLQQKQTQLTDLQHSTQHLEKELFQHEQTISNIKTTLKLTTIEKNKNDKIIQFLKQQIQQNKIQQSKSYENHQRKQKLQSNLQTQLEKSSQKSIKLQNKYTALKKQYNRFQQQIHESLSTLSFHLPLTTTQLKPTNYQLASQPSDKTINDMTNTGQAFFGSSVIRQLNEQHREIVSAMTKLVEQNKLLQQQTVRLSQEMLDKLSQNQLKQSQLKLTINKLQTELTQISNQAQEKHTKNTQLIHQLQKQLQQRQNTYNELHEQISQMNQVIKIVNVQYEANSQHCQTKQNYYNSKIGQLQEKINQSTNALNNCQTINQELSIKLRQIINQLEQQKHNNSQKQYQLSTLTQQLSTNQHTAQQWTKYRKQLHQCISELELKLSTQTQLKQKAIHSLETQQHKNAQLKQFIANIMKQKQAIIKGDIGKYEQIRKLQAQLKQNNKTIQIKNEHISQLTKHLSQQKQQTKNLTTQLQSLTLSTSDHQSQISNLTSKLKQKQLQLNQSTLIFTTTKQQLQMMIHKLNKQKNQCQSEMKEQLEKKDKNLGILVREYQEMEEKYHERERKIGDYKLQIDTLQQNIFMQKQNSERRIQQSIKLSEQLSHHKTQITHLQSQLTTLTQHLNQKQLTTTHLLTKQTKLETKLQTLKTTKSQQISHLTTTLHQKYTLLLNNAQQKYQQLEKQKNKIKINLQQKQQQYKKLYNLQRIKILQQTNTIKILEEKLNRLEQDKRNIIGNKNQQIKKLEEHQQMQLEHSKYIEIALRKVQHEVELNKTVINKLEQNKMENQEKIKNMHRNYQNQIQLHKKKQAIILASNLQLGRIQSELERDIKSAFQDYLEKLVENKLKQQGGEIQEMAKILEEDIIRMVQNKFGQYSIGD